MIEKFASIALGLLTTVIPGRVPVRMLRILLCGLVVLVCSGVLAESGGQDPFQELLSGNTDPEAVAAKVPAEDLADVQALNNLRLQLKAQDKSAVAQSFFSVLAEREPSDAVLLNLSLSYVDQMMGKNLLQQGTLSTRSQDTVEKLNERDPKNWIAWYIRGINNLYWPDWFRKAPLAREYLEQALAIYRELSPQEKDEHDGYALGYLTLGDAYALLDQPDEARKIWEEGRHAYPYVAMLRERMSLSDTEQHAAVRVFRDVDKPIDTDLALLWNHQAPPFSIALTGGTLYGPGPLEDQPLSPGSLRNLYLGGTLSGLIPAFNNGKDEPNLPGETLQGGTVDGLLADGSEANENVDVGYVEIMNGKFKLFLSAVQDGPSEGIVHFFLDDGWHWTIFDDIAIDPGFPVGVIKIRDFTWSTSPRVLPVSRQTEAKAPAGVDRSGSITSGAVVPGALGDSNFDGKLDGTFNAIGRFPYDSVILPGTPFCQTRSFDSDIPVSAEQAALLTLANALGHLRLALDLGATNPEQAESLRSTFNERMVEAKRHAENAKRLPEPTRQAIEDVKVDPDEAGLCEAWRRLRDAAPAQGLNARAFNASGIRIECAGCENQ
ncbi:MAG: tetratricopeptide repeat protein, partial [Gammaproteobacteria bacterium]